MINSQKTIDALVVDATEQLFAAYDVKVTRQLRHELPLIEAPEHPKQRNGHDALSLARPAIVLLRAG